MVTEWVEGDSGRRKRKTAHPKLGPPLEQPLVQSGVFIFNFSLSGSERWPTTEPKLRGPLLLASLACCFSWK